MLYKICSERCPYCHVLLFTNGFVRCVQCIACRTVENFVETRVKVCTCMGAQFYFDACSCSHLPHCTIFVQIRFALWPCTIPNVFLRCIGAGLAWFFTMEWTVFHRKYCILHPGRGVKHLLNDCAKLIWNYLLIIHCVCTLKLKIPCTVRAIVNTVRLMFWELSERAPPIKSAVLCGPSQLCLAFARNRHFGRSLCMMLTRNESNRETPVE